MDKNDDGFHESIHTIDILEIQEMLRKRFNFCEWMQ